MIFTDKVVLTIAATVWALAVVLGYGLALSGTYMHF